MRALTKVSAPRVPAVRLSEGFERYWHHQAKTLQPLSLPRQRQRLPAAVTMPR